MKNFRAALNLLFFEKCLKLGKKKKYLRLFQRNINLLFNKNRSPELIFAGEGGKERATFIDFKLQWLSFK